MSILQQAARKAEKEKEERRLKKLIKHKCNKCDYSSWTGTKFYCPFINCAKESLSR